MTVNATAPTRRVQTNAFSTAGFVELPGLLSGERLQRARVAANRAIRTADSISCERPNNTLVPLRWDSPLVELVLDAHDRIARTVRARDLRWISG